MNTEELRKFDKALEETNKIYSGMLKHLATSNKVEKEKNMDWKTWAQETLEVLRKELGEATKNKLLEAVRAGESLDEEYNALRNQIMDYQSDPNYDKQRNIGAELLATALLNDNYSGVMTGVAGELQKKIRSMNALLSERLQNKLDQALSTLKNHTESNQHYKEVLEENEKLREKIKKFIEMLKECTEFEKHQDHCRLVVNYRGDDKCTCLKGKIRDAVNEKETTQ